jgi:threonine synthase
LAEKLGLPVRKFVAASNINDSVPKYLSTGTFTPHPSHQTISNAMDVGNPSNFARMLELFPDGMNKTIFGASFDDKETSQAIFRIHNQYNYVVDPHTAIAFLGLQKYQHTHKDTTGIVLSTAHPAKFLDIVESIIQQKIPLPPQLEHAMKKQKVSIPIENDYAQMVKVLLG